MTDDHRLLKGMITRTFNRFYEVTVGTDRYMAQPKGHLRRSANRDYRLPVIGDRVSLNLESGRDGVDGYVVSIEPRKNSLARHGNSRAQSTHVMAANLDQILVVSGIAKPGLDWNLIDRYLVSCAILEVPAVVVLNKIDLNFDALLAPELQIYRDLGYVVLETSVKEGLGMDQLAAIVESGISFFTGASGVGKSTLINWLVPEAKLPTGHVNQRSGSGRHTTTSSVLTTTGSGGYVVDSPGLRDFRPPPFQPESIRFGYVEIAEAQSECKFSTCLHLEEPGCAVRELTRLGQISNHRYLNYRRTVNEMMEHHRTRF